MFAVRQLRYSKNVCDKQPKHASYMRYGNGGFRGSVGMGILWGLPQVFLWVWDGDGYGD